MSLEAAINMLCAFGYSIYFQPCDSVLGLIHITKDNQTWVLYSMQELIEFAERREVVGKKETEVARREN